MNTAKTEKDTKLKLLIATDNFLPRWDGIARFLNEIIPKLTAYYDITVVAPKFGKFEAENYKLITIPLSGISLGDYTGAKINRKKIMKLVQESDVVFSQTIGPIGATAIIQAKKNRKPVASFMHSIDWELVPMATNIKLVRRIMYPFMKTYSKYIYNKTNLIIVPSEGISDLITWQNIRVKKEIVHLGVDTEIFKPYTELTDKEKENRETLRKELGLEDKYVIGTHGRIAYEKDLFTLLRAFNWLQKKHKDAKLLIIGDGVPQIKDKLKQVPGVIMTGSKNDAQRYLNIMDAYVTSSLTETTSLTTLEAMGSGLPVISTPVGFIQEYIKENVNGFTFPKGDSFSLFKQLDLLKNNPSLAKQIGQRARKTIVTGFKWDDTVNGIKSALKSIEF